MKRHAAPANLGVPEFGRKFSALLLLLLSTPAWLSSQEGTPADAALARLLEGNHRYVKHRLHHPDESIARRNELVNGQHPFAVVLGCADSRVAPELLFDQGLGDLFVIRIAGNIVDDAVLGSIEYGVEHLGARLVLVLGHEKCGAVSAAIEGGKPSGHLGVLFGAIQPSVEETANSPGDRVHNCVIANARRVANQLRESAPILKEYASKGVKVVAADYVLDTGVVNLLDAAK
jgi:carbonic anhydrase